MIKSIIILLLLIHLKLFKGWYLALWVIDVVVEELILFVKEILED